jgi:tetratricopeptide (TPR) repeat protein
LVGALDRRPCQPACYRRAARAYQRAGEGARALELLERAVHREGADTELREALAQAYLDVGRFEEAIAQCREILRRAPRRLPVLDLMGSAYVQSGRLSEAAEALRQQLRLTPMDPTLHFRLGALYHEQGRFREALTAFSQVLSLAPDSGLADAADEAVGAIDNFQFQRIAILAAEDQQFRLKVGRNPTEALGEYGFHLSPPAFALVQMLDFDGLVETLRAPANITYH